MFDPRKLFKPKEADQQITSLNLEPPPAAPSTDQKFDPLSLQRAIEANRAAIQNSPAQQEINQRTKLLLESGNHPKGYFFAATPDTKALIIFQSKEPPRKAMLFFSSPFLATDYLRATNTQGAIGHIPVEALPQMAPKWRAAGVDSFLLNRCPRCPVALFYPPVDGVITDRQLLLAWSISKAVSTWRGQQLMRQYLSHKGENLLPHMRTTLECLRDHVDCGVPYVHWAIALLAGMQGDEEARLANTARLEEFGPDFVGKTWVLKDPKDLPAWGELMSKAMIGLLATYEMLKIPPQPAGDQTQAGQTKADDGK